VTDLAGLTSLYERPGPFVTVYLDASRDTESGQHEVETRWRDVRATLDAQGADTATLDAIGAAVDADRSSAGRHGLIVVAAGGDVGLHGRLRQPPAVSTGTFSPLPRLLPYLAQQSAQVPHLVVVADHAGADLLTGDVTRPAGSATVTGSDRDDWSERHFHQRVENSWDATRRTSRPPPSAS
jgi:hypothetical protein